MNDAITMSLVYALIFVSVSYLAWVLIQIIDKRMKAYEDVYVGQVSKSLEEMFVFRDPKRLFQINVSITVLFFLFGLFVFNSLLYAILLGVGGFFLPRLFIWRAKRKRLQMFDEQLVDGLNVLSNALKSGLTMVQAIESLENELYPPISQEFGLVLREYKVGVPLDQALKNLTQRIPSEDLNLMVTSINIVQSVGGNLREIFDIIAKMVTERHKLELKTRALTAQGRSQGIIVGLLPAILGGVMFLMDPTLMLPFVTTAAGNVGIAAILFLQIMGYIMIKKIVTIEI
jgi:tight adherence protein B